MKKSHNKGLSLLIISVVTSPILIIIWMIGWILYCIGSQKLPITKRKEQVTLQKITQKENFEQELAEPQILA
ncbi:MAG TPA: hypothetical protein VMX17_00930 [Candidatus Glassbacteria bacterium]|nr:hypothetical protein [Candidatus Glassbacteria bacterium]